MADRPLVIFDLDGTTGLYHLCKELGKVFLRPELPEAFALLSDCRLALATRAEEVYARAVTEFLADRGVRFDAVFARPQVALRSPGTWAGYYKSYSGILEHFGMDRPDRAVIIGDLMTFYGVPVFDPRDYRRCRFSFEPSLLSTSSSLTDHPVDRRIVYVVVPQVLTRQRSGEPRSLSMLAPVRAVRRLLDRGAGSFLEGYAVRRRFDGPDEKVQSDLLSQRMSAEVAAGIEVRCPRGTPFSDQFQQPYEPHRYLVVKGRRRDWKPVVECEATIEIPVTG